MNEGKPGLRGYLKALGPGLVTGASDDDPSGIATYAQAGANAQYATLWTALLSLPVMMAVQEICDRTALATGQSLGDLARRRFARASRAIIALLLVALLAANGLNLAADLMAVGEGLSLLHAGPAPLWSALTGIGLSAFLIRGSFEALAKVFKWLCLSLLTYVVVLFAVKISWSQAMQGLLGLQIRHDSGYWKLIVAILGTTISPYLFFWQSAHRVEEMRDKAPENEPAVPLRRRNPIAAEVEERESRVDVFTGMAFSQLVMVAIIIATAATVGTTEQHNIASAADAAKALEPIAGSASSVLFAIGFIGAGVLSVPVLAASASVGLAGLAGKDWGFERSPRQAPLFYTLVMFGTVGGTVLGAVLSDPFGLLVLAALVNGVAAAPFLIVTMLVARDRELMGEYRNGKLASTIGWAAVVVMTTTALIGLAQALSS